MFFAKFAFILKLYRIYIFEECSVLCARILNYFHKLFSEGWNLLSLKILVLKKYLKMLSGYYFYEYDPLCE